MSDTAAPAVRVTRRINAPISAVYDAWLDPASFRRWLFATPTGTVIRAESDARIGGKFTVVDRRGDDDVEHVGEYVELDRPRRLVFLFSLPAYSPDSTRVAVDFADGGDGCEVILSHYGVGAEWVEKTVQGWTMILDGLAATVVSG